MHDKHSEWIARSHLSLYLQGSKDLVCLMQLEMVEVYFGINWKKKYKAPTEFGFALKVRPSSSCITSVIFINFFFFASTAS